MADVVLGVLSSLDDDEIPFCVLRNFEFVTGNAVDGDIDILARAEHRETIAAHLERAGFQPADGDTSEQTTFVQFLPQARSLLVLDLYWDAPTYNGVPLLDGDRTLRNRRRYEGIFVPGEEDYFVELVFHPALNKNGYHHEYRSELDRLRNSVDAVAVREHARTVFGRCGVEAVDEALDGHYERVVEMKWKFVAAGLRRDPALAPSLGWNLFGRREIRKPLLRLKRRYSPFDRKPVVALLGPDGSGKTSVASELERVFADNGFDPVRRELGVYNGETALMRLAKRADSSVRTDDGADSGGTSTESRSLGPRNSPAKAAVHLADIGLRQLQAELAKGSAIVADRYAHDIALYDETTGLGWVLELFEREPFYPIVLTGDPEVIGERSEYDVDSVREMQSRLEAYEFPTVDATQDLDAVVTEVLETVFADDRLLRASNYRLY